PSPCANAKPPSAPSPARTSVAELPLRQTTPGLAAGTGGGGDQLPVASRREGVEVPTATWGEASATRKPAAVTAAAIQRPISSEAARASRRPTRRSAAMPLPTSGPRKE